MKNKNKKRIDIITVERRGEYDDNNIRAASV